MCSQPGLQWVTERSGSQAFSAIARSLMLSWSQRLKFQWQSNKPRAPEPDIKTAWLYTKTYFESSFEAFYGVVYRPEFEARLARHFDEHGAHDDPSWYALRHVVYATGCRTLLAQQKPVRWAEVHRQSWPFFENALSVYVELLYTQTGLSAVRALAAMNLHVEGAANPALEAMMCASAVRLGQSKGLHRQPASNWRLSEDEILHRNWLFWAIYVHEKQVTHRSGRPSDELTILEVIDDDNISSQIPASIVSGSTIDMGFLRAMVDHARISAQINKQLLSVTGLRRTTADMMQKMADLNSQLESWKASLPTKWQPGADNNTANVDSTRELNRTLYLHFSYYGSLTAIHTVFFYPWISITCGVDPHIPVHGKQIAESTRAVAEAARDIIRTTRTMHIDAASPQWLVFYFPMVGLINLFLSILKHPSDPSALTDVALIDVVVGHFGHLEVISESELSYPFAREIASIAYQVVKRHGDRPKQFNRPDTPSEAIETAPEFDLDIPSEILAAFDIDNFGPLGLDGLPSEGDMIYFEP